MIDAIDQVLPATFGAKSCHFPTIGVEQSRIDSFAIVEVFTDSDNKPANHHEQWRGTEVILAAWAVLLHAYVRNQVVAFAKFDTSYDASFNKNGIKGADRALATQIIEYDFTGEVTKHQIFGPIKIQSLTDTRLNTIVGYPTRLPATHHDSVAACNVLVHLMSVSSVRSVSQCSRTMLIAMPQLDLALNITDTGLKMIYRTSTISAAYANSISQFLQEILEELPLDYSNLNDYSKNVSEYDTRLLREWTTDLTPAPKECLHNLFEAYVRTAPNVDAVCGWDGSFTYAELDLLSTNFATALGEAGIIPGVYVPFAFEKSSWTVVATLAILKAGGALVPLDPAHPTARLLEIIHATNAKLVVTSEVYASQFRQLVDRVVVVSSNTVSFLNKVSTSHAENPRSRKVHAEDPAIVLFTSGSTGKPKGIVLQHSAICSHTLAHGQAMQYHKARVLQFAAHTFDVAIMDIFTTLAFGGCVCIPSDVERSNDLPQAMNRMRVELAILMPQLARIIDPSEVPTLRILATGGEPLPKDCLERWAEALSFIQIYGPAEVGICILTRMNCSTRPETVGHPLPNCGCWLVDVDDPNKLVPIGAIGELVVAGPSLAKGYLNDDGKTRSAFLYDLDWAKTVAPNCKVFYKTGDLLRYNTHSMNGSFDFVARKDSQIKLRGQRIEPREIEHQLSTMPEISVSMVIRPERGGFAGQLVAVLKMKMVNVMKSPPFHEHHPEAGEFENLSSSDLAAMIGQRLVKVLPGYMVPTVYLGVTSIPFTASHKIDRNQVRQWLEAAARRTNAGLTHLTCSHLEAGEMTSQILSRKVAGLVACDDPDYRNILEAHDFEIWKTGLNSIQIMSFAFFVRRRFGVSIPAMNLLRPGVKIRDVARLIDFKGTQGSSMEQGVDLMKRYQFVYQELLKHIELHPSGPKRQQKHPRNVLLTGATGFLGAAILKHLLIFTGMNVSVLVRCYKKEDGFRRVVDAATNLGWWNEGYRQRLRVWPGDLQEPCLGLDAFNIQRMISQDESRGDYNIDAVIHNGARVHYASSFEMLEKINIQSTVELLKLTASSNNISAFVFVSGGRKPSELALDDEAAAVIANQLRLAGGYSQTKFVSEQLIRSCVTHPRFENMSFSTVLPGYIIGNLETGKANTTDFLWRLVAGCVEVGAYNIEEIDRWLYLADADLVASRVVLGMLEPNQPSGHLEAIYHGLTFGNLWHVLMDHFGYELEGLQHSEWNERLVEAVSTTQEKHLLFPLLGVLEGEGSSLGDETVSRTSAVLESSQVMETVKANVKHLISIGFLPGPPGGLSNGHK